MKLKHAAVFPGQGSQYLGMLSDLESRYPVVTKLFDLVSERLGYDVWNLVQNGPIEKLNQTEYTQVAVLTADVAIYTILKNEGLISPSIMAGHSLGEYAALVCAGALDLVDAAQLVQIRGRLMQDTIPLGTGAMAAIIGLSDAEVLALCEKASLEKSIVSPANYNAIGQVVIAGHTEAVLRAIELAEAARAMYAKTIPVSVPCHCGLLEEASIKFAETLEITKFNIPKIPVISNVDLSIYQSEEQIRTLLSQQLYSPVRWVETIGMIKQSGVDLIVECGPGKVLSGLVKRIDKSLEAISIYDEASLLRARSI